MRFNSPRDYAAIVKINKELLNTVLDINVVLYKLNQKLSVTNSYGESVKKVWYTGVEVPALIERLDTGMTEEMQTVDVNQDITFAFLRQELQDRGIYPEMSDIVFYDNQLYEIHNTNEIQLWGGRVEYRHSIVCESHLTRSTNLQLDPPIR